MAANISKVVAQIKSNIRSVLPGDVIVLLCRELGYKWRERCLDPVTTLHAFLVQILYGNTACDHLPRLMGKSFTGEAYCMARSKLPLALFQRLIQAVCGVFKSVCHSAEWLGHRVDKLNSFRFIQRLRSSQNLFIGHYRRHRLSPRRAILYVEYSNPT